MSTAGPPDLSNNGPVVATPVPLGVQELVSGRPGFPTLQVAAYAYFDGASYGWRLQVAAKPLSSLGDLWLVPDSGLPAEAGNLTLHGGVMQDQPGGGWQVWSWQPQMVASSWSWVQTSEMLVFTWFTTARPVGAQLETTQTWEQILDSLPDSAQVSKDWLRRGAEFAAGMANRLTGGIADTSLGRYLVPRGLANLGGYVNTQSSSYVYGQYAGQIVQIALNVYSPFGATSQVLGLVQTVAGASNAIEAYSEGRIKDGNEFMVGLGLSALHAVGPCALGSVAGAAAQAFGIFLARGQVENGMARVAAGDLWGFLDMAEGASNAVAMARASCFTREQQLLTPSGWMRMDELAENQKLAASNENNPFGAIEYKPILKVFEFPPARIWHVQVKGKFIRTTAEHPFYVWGKGWVAARELEAGDRLRTHDGRMAAVEQAYNSSVFEPVFNCSVADHHTYFVGDEEWGFSVWAHNSTCVVDYSENGIRALGRKTKFDKTKLAALGLTRSQITKVRQKARELSRKRGDPSSGPLLARSNRPGTRGGAAHQADVQGAGRQFARSLRRPGERVLTERPIQGHPGIDRIADNQVVDRNGVTRVVVESEARVDGPYHVARVQQLEGAGIEVYTRPQNVWRFGG
jgi:hypothetical protein